MNKFIIVILCIFDHLPRRQRVNVGRLIVGDVRISHTAWRHRRRVVQRARRRRQDVACCRKNHEATVWRERRDRGVDDVARARRRAHRAIVASARPRAASERRRERVRYSRAIGSTWTVVRHDNRVRN